MSGSAGDRLCSFRHPRGSIAVRYEAFGSMLFNTDTLLYIDEPTHMLDQFKLERVPGLITGPLFLCSPRPSPGQSPRM